VVVRQWKILGGKRGIVKEKSSYHRGNKWSYRLWGGFQCKVENPWISVNPAPGCDQDLANSEVNSLRSLPTFIRSSKYGIRKGRKVYHVSTFAGRSSRDLRSQEFLTECGKCSPETKSDREMLL